MRALAVTFMVAAAAVFSALPLRLEADVIVRPQAAEVSARAAPGAPVTVTLAFAARDVALRWAGAASAQVKVAFSRDGAVFAPAMDAGRDEVGEQRANGRTYGLLLPAAGARFVRVTSDCVLPDLRVVGVADGAATVSRHLAAARAEASGVPAILSRAQWGADESLRYDAAGNEKWSPAFNPIQKMIVHHTDTQNGDPDPAATIRAIYYYHAVTQGWGDIGYNFLIDDSGRVYKGRNSHTTTASIADDTITGEDSAGGGVTGAHAAGFNSGNVGIALLGTLSTQDATPAAKSALEDLLAWKANRHGIDPQGSSTYVNPVTGAAAFLPNIVGHRDVNATECPGGIFYANLPDVRAAAAGRIAAAPPDFTVFASPPSRTVPPGGAASYAVSLTGQSGFNAAVTLSAQGVPPGATDSFSPPSVVPGQTSILTISTGGSSTGASSIAVMATSGTLGHTANVGLRVGATDTTPPTVAITAHPPAATTDGTATFSFVATDPDDASSSLTSACSLDDSPFGACTSPSSYTGLAPGSHVFVVRSTDPAGNGGSGTFPWTVKPPRSGYWMVGSTGDVYAFGDAPYAGGAPLPGGAAATGIAAAPSGHGYRVVDSRGDVYAFGDAGYVGGSPPLRPGEQVTSLSSTPDGGGYWLFTNAGRAFAYGAARPFGDMGAVRLNGPVLGSVATPSGNGYSMVAADGGIFAFGDARFAGSMGDRHLNKPVVGMAPNPNGPGYWLVAADGGVFAFGPPFQGSMGSTRLNAPVIGMVSYGNGYLMVASDGGIFDFSDRAFRGSLGGIAPRHPVVAVTALNG
jgi:hypothetical protein